MEENLTAPKISGAAMKKYNTMIQDIYNSLVTAHTVEEPFLKTKDFFKPTKNTTYHIADDYLSKHSSIFGFNFTDFDLPHWGIPDFINEKSSWQKSVHNLTGDPGFFYFKIFFKFNTNYGLLGGIMGDNEGAFSSTNTALNYLTMNQKFYNHANLSDRIIALKRFVGTLSFINSEAPWFFKSINNLNTVYNTYLQDFTKEKYIEIGVTEDAVDMRLNMLFDLYKFATFDNINCKEIIPENLRKFDMSVLVFHTPIRYFQTAMMAKSADVNIPFTGSKLNSVLNSITAAAPSLHKYKTFSGNGDLDNAISSQMFTFQNCEFDVDSFGNYYSNLNNEKAFNLGKNSIKIKFDRCFKHHFNEWNQIFIGPDKIIHDSIDKKNSKYNINSVKKRVKDINVGMQSKYYDTHQMQFKGLVDFTEYLIANGLRENDMSELFIYTNGNLYGDFGTNSGYYNYKLKWLKEGTINPISNLYNGEGVVIKREYTQLTPAVYIAEKGTYEALFEKVKTQATNFFKW